MPDRIRPRDQKNLLRQEEGKGRKRCTREKVDYKALTRLSDQEQNCWRNNCLRLKMTSNKWNLMQTVREDRRLENYLGCFTSDRPREWVRWLPWAEWWYNTIPLIIRQPNKDRLKWYIYRRPPPLITSYTH